jgi:hypothetical protein
MYKLLERFCGKLGSQEEKGYDSAFLVSICTEIWRLQKKVRAQISHGELQQDQIMKYLERIDCSLEDANIMLHDHTGEKYFPGTAVKIIGFQPCDSVPEGEERIIETVKPTIYCNGVVFKQGEVIVGMFKEKGEDKK